MPEKRIEYGDNVEWNITLNGKKLNPIEVHLTGSVVINEDGMKHVFDMVIIEDTPRQTECHYCKSTDIFDKFKYKTGGKLYCSSYCYAKELKEEGK